MRLGTADFYSVLDTFPEVADALVIHLEDPDGGMGELVLFVQLEDDVPFSAELSTRISRELKTRLSPSHTPDEVVPVTRIPLGRTGKKLEVPVKRIVQGATADSVASAGALQDPKSLDEYVDYATDTKGEGERMSALNKLSMWRSSVPESSVPRGRRDSSPPGTL